MDGPGVHGADHSGVLDTGARGDAEGERAARNERRLHTAIRAAALRVPAFPLEPAGSGLFRSVFIGGFECATHRRRDGRRLDLAAATGHDRLAFSDYQALAGLGIQTVRDGVRWHRIETAPGRYDWSSFLPMLRAARDAGVQAIWDLCHWGWPDDIDIWSPAFVDRFGRFAGAVARIVREETDDVPFYTPVNEISFWSWAGGSLAYINPLAEGRGDELKAMLVRAAIAGVEAVRAVDPRARIVTAEPVINLIPRSEEPADVEAARAYTESQFQVFDFLSGRQRPELGGRPDYLDVVGVNYYLHNQWIDGDLPIGVDHPRHRPVSLLLADVYTRYRRPIFLAETGIEGELRPAWLRVICSEVRAARRSGIPVESICLYPITDYPGWDDERPCPTGLLGPPNPRGVRSVFGPLADEILRHQPALRVRRAAC